MRRAQAKRRAHSQDRPSENPRPDWEASWATFWAVEGPELVGVAASGISFEAVWGVAAQAVHSVARRVAGFSVPG
jgi:hypothetical protein